MSNEVEVQETLNDQLQVRREKMHQLREKGVEPFSTGFKQKQSTEEIHQQFEGATKESLAEQEEVTVQIAGRIMTKRGKVKQVLRISKMVKDNYKFMFVKMLSETKLMNYLIKLT